MGETRFVDMNIHLSTSIFVGVFLSLLVVNCACFYQIFIHLQLICKDSITFIHEIRNSLIVNAQLSLQYYRFEFKT